MNLRNKKRRQKNRGQRQQDQVPDQIQELPDATPETLPLYHGLYILEANINRHLYDYDYFPSLFEEKINCYKRREFHRLNLRMKNAVNEIFSGNFDEKYRILSINIQLDNGKTVHCLIDLIPHDYDTNKYMNMNPREMRDFKEILKIKIQNDLEFSTNIENTTDDDLKEALPSVSLKQYIDFMGNQFLTFDEMQTVAINQRKRFIGLGAPNTGKSIVGIEILKNYVIWLDETGDDDGGDIYCIVQSEVLINTLIGFWNKSDLPNHLKPRVQFVTVKQLFEKHYPDRTFISNEDVINILSNKKDKLSHLNLITNIYQINFKQFQNDCTRNTKLKGLFTKETLTEKIIYEEFRIMFGFTKEEYIGDDKKLDAILGEREAKFGGPGDDGKNKERRAYLWDKREGIKAFLEKNKLMHIEFASLPNGTKIKFCWLDEFLDLSPSLVFSILLATDLDLFVTGDVHQNIFWARANLKYINRKIRDLSRGEIEFKIIDLPITHLVSNAVKNASNRSLKLKIFLGGLNYKNQYTEINTAATDAEEGQEEWITITEKQKYSSLKVHPSIIRISGEIEQEPENFLVVIPDENFREDAKELFPQGTIILTIAQAKGQHYDTVILFGPLDHPAFQDEFIAANNKLKEKNIKSEEDIIITNSLAPRGAETEGGIGNYYTSQTRAWRRIFAIQQQRHNINELINYLKPKPRIILNNELNNAAPIIVPAVIEVQNAETNTIEVIPENTPVPKSKKKRNKAKNEDTYQARLNGLKKLIDNKNLDQARDFYVSFMKVQFNLDISFDEFSAQIYSTTTAGPSKIDSDASKDENTQNQDQTLTDTKSHRGRGRGRNQRGGRNGNRSGRGGRTDNRNVQTNQNQNLNKNKNENKKEETTATVKPQINQTNKKEQTNTAVKDQKQPQVNKEIQKIQSPDEKIASSVKQTTVVGEKEIKAQQILKFTNALWENNTDVVKEFIKNGLDLNTSPISVKDGTGKYNLIYALNLAVACQHVELVKIILNVPNIDVNKVGEDSVTALHKAIEMKNIEIINLLLNHKGTDINKKSYVLGKGLICPYRHALESGLSFLTIANLLIQDRRLDIDDDEFKFVIMNYSSIAEKYIQTSRAYIINNFNEETIIDLFTHKPFMNILFYYIDSSDKSNTIFNFIINDPKCLGLFIECVVKRHEGKNLLLSLLKRTEETKNKGSSIVGVSKESISGCVNQLMMKLTAEQLLILNDDLYKAEPIDKMIDVLIMKQLIFLKVSRLNQFALAIRMGLAKYVENKLPFLLKGELSENTMIDFIKIAIENGHSAIVRELATSDLTELTPENLDGLLKFAIDKNRPTIFAGLLAYIDIDQIEKYNLGGVREKINQVKSESIKQLLIHELEKIVKESSDKKSCKNIIIEAINKNQLATIESHIKNNVDLNFVMESGFTPLMTAVKNQNENLVKLLLTSKSIDVDKYIKRLPNEVISAFTLAVNSRNTNILTLLLKDPRTILDASVLEPLYNMALQLKHTDFYNSVDNKYKALQLSLLDVANYNEDSFTKFLQCKFPAFVLFDYQEFINALNRQTNAWLTLSKCLMKESPQNNQSYMYNLLVGNEESKDKSNHENAKIILSKMSTEHLFLLLDSFYQKNKKADIALKSIEELITLKYINIIDKLKYAIKVNCITVIKHDLNDKNINITPNDLSELLLEASDNGKSEIVGLILKSIKLDQLTNINFKAAIDKAKNEKIKQKLVRSQYFVGLLKQFNSVSVANLLASKEAILFLFEKDILSENLFTIIMANSQTSHVFLQCLLAPHGSIKSAKVGNDKVNETYIKIDQVYISRFLGIKENQFVNYDKFKEISQALEVIYGLEFLLKLLNANCTKKDGKYSINNLDAVKSISDRTKFQTLASIDKINYAIEFGSVNLVGFFLQQAQPFTNSDLISFLKAAIVKNNLDIIKIILEDKATKQGIHSMEINVACLCSEAKTANVDEKIVIELTKYLQTEQSIFKLPSNSSTNTPSAENMLFPPKDDNNDPKILQDNSPKK